MTRLWMHGFFRAGWSLVFIGRVDGVTRIMMRPFDAVIHVSGGILLMEH